jgi:spore maturation protein A
MMNRIWFWLLLVGIVYGFGKAAVQTFNGAQQPVEAAVEVVDATDGVDAGADAESTTTGPFQQQGEALTNAALEAAALAVEICIGLIGIMVLWLGLLNIAKDAGLVDALARALGPVMRWLFPEIPAGHPAHGAMLMNISANMLGLENAATPFGLQAMRELQTLNPSKDTATNSMATFLAINTSNVTLVPITIIALRVSAGSNNPTQPLAGMILTTTITTIVAVVAVRMLARQTRYRFDQGPPADPSTPSSNVE